MLNSKIIANFANYKFISGMLKKDMFNRLKQVQKQIKLEQADACVIASSVNLYYLNGFIFNGYMYILPEGEPIFFVKRPVTLSGNNVIAIRKPEQIPDFLSQLNIPLPKNILFENDVIPYSSAIRFQKALSLNELKSVSAYMRTLRSIKSENELDEIRRTAAVHVEIYKELPKLYRTGMTDLEFQIEIEYLMRKKGSIGSFRSFGENMDIFMGSVLSGNNAEEASPFDFTMGGKGIDPLLPLGATNNVMKKGTTVMIDMAGNFNPYMSDMTRTFSIGKIPQKALKAHQLSIDIHKDILSFAKEGVACSEIYNRVMAIVSENKMEQYFMGTKQQAKFVGHGIGLEVNEPPVLAPRSRDSLLEGMVIAIEPKFVLPEIGAVGVENTYIVTKHGLENITICNEEIIELS